MTNELRRPWLARTVGRSLINAYVCVADSCVADEAVTIGDVEFSRNVLAIRFTEQKRLVQIIDFENDRAIISDGLHHIEAIFSEAATQSFKEKDARNVAKLNGGLVVVLDFTLKFDQSLNSLSLEIISFQFGGSEGLDKINLPVDISLHDDISKALEELRTLMSGSGASPEGDSDSESIESQEEIATQLYARRQQYSQAKNRNDARRSEKVKSYNLPPVVTSETDSQKLVHEPQTLDLMKSVVQVQDAQIVSDLRIDNFQVDSPFLGMKRVPRRHVARRAHKELLDTDCWYKPENNDRPRYANIPAEIRIELERFLERKADILGTKTGTNDEDFDNDAGISEDEEEDVDRDEADVRNALHLSMDGSKVSEMIEPNIATSRLDKSSIQSSPPTKSPRPLAGDREDLVELDSDQCSWPTSSDNNNESDDDDASDSNGGDNAVIGESTEEIRTMMSSGFPASVYQSSLISEASQSHMVLPHAVHKGSNLRIPLVFPSSPAEVDELEISAPYAVGDMLDENESTGPQVLSQVNPSTAPQSSTSVQVKRTPRTTSPQNANAQSGNVQKMKARQHISIEGFSDEIIPATCEGGSSGNSKEAAISRRLPQTDREDLSELMSAVNHRPIVSQSEQLHDNMAFKRWDDSSRQVSQGIKSPIFIKRKVPSASREHSSPPLNSVNPKAMKSPGNIQVPSTQMSPVSVRSRRQVLGSGVLESSGERKARLRIAAKLLERDKSPIKDTDEMVRVARRSWLRENELENKNLPEKHVPNSPPQATTILESSPISHPTALASSGPVSNSASNEHQSSQTQLDDLVKSTLEAQIDQILDLPASSPAQPASAHGDEAHSDDSHEQSNTAFIRFKDAYPDFTGSEKKFTQAIVYIEWLQSTSKHVHQSLFDDLIRVYATVYPPWVAEQSAAKLSPKLSCWEFYEEKVHKPLYHYLVISRRSLSNDVFSLDQNIVETTRNLFKQHASKIPHSSVRSTLKHTVNEVIKAAESVAVEEDAILEMRQSDIEIRPELLDSYIERAPSRSPESSKSSSIAGITPAELDHDLSPISPPQLQRTRPPYFQTASQALQTKEQTKPASITSRASPLQARASAANSKTLTRRSLPWIIETTSSPASASPTLPRAFPKARNLPDIQRPARSFDRPSPLHTLSDPFLSDEIGRRASKKRLRERSPILGSTPEPEPEPESEHESASKHRRISKSLSSSIRRNTSFRAPPSSSDVNSRNMATVPQADQATKVSGWMNDLPQLKEERARKGEAKDREQRGQFAKPQEVNGATRVMQKSQSKPTVPAMPVLSKSAGVQKSASKGMGNVRAPMTAEERRAAFKRKLDKRGVGLKFKPTTPTSTPAKEGGSGSGSGSGSSRI